MLDVDAGVTVDALEQRLLECERVIAAARAEQVAALRALDAVQVHLADGCRSMVEWVAARLDVSHDTARLLTRATRQVPDHPGVAARLTDGDIGLERAVATAELAAVAPPGVVERADGHDLGGLRRLVTLWRGQGRRGERQVFTERFVSLQPSLDEGTLRGRFEVPGFEGEIVTAALTTRADLFGGAPGPRIPKPARMADALVSIAQDALEGIAEHTDRGRTEPVVSIFVDAAAAAPSRGEAGAGLSAGPGVLEEMLCTGRIGVVLVQDGTPVSVTPDIRGIPKAIRRLVLARDGGCTVAGCRSRYRLQPHHLVPYAAGGSHHPSNLTALCWFHHHVVVHRLGYRLDPDSPPGRRRFLRTNTGTDPPEH